MDEISTLHLKRTSRRRFLKAGFLGAAGLAVYAGELERHWIEVKCTEIQLRGLPAAFNGMRIAQLSDIHMDEFTEPFHLRHAISKINALKADAVLITGDFVSEGPIHGRFALGAAWQCAGILDSLECRTRYACMGNHDVAVGSEHVTEALTSNGITVLNNAFLPLERGSSRLWLAGLDDPFAGAPDIEKAIPKKIRSQAEEPIVLLCHAPDFADELVSNGVSRSVGLVLSGHTHGGQIRVPFFGPLTLPPLGQRYVEGRFQLGPMQLYVNRGIGTVGVPFRFDCPPEITLITLRRA